MIRYLCGKLLGHCGLRQSKLAPDGRTCLCGTYCRFADETR